MTRLFELHPEELLIWLAILAALVAVGFYVVGKIRTKPIQQEPLAGELLTKFREWHSKGILSDTEFRTIKTTLTVQLRDELKDNGDKG